MTDTILTTTFSSAAAMEVCLWLYHIKREDIISITADRGIYTLVYVHHTYSRAEKQQIRAEKQRRKEREKTATHLFLGNFFPGKNPDFTGAKRVMEKMKNSRTSG